MVSQGVLMTLLGLTVVFDIVPLIAAIVLLATKKLKGSAFWSGVGIAVIASIIGSVVSLIAAGISGITITTDGPVWILALQQGVIAAADVLLILLFFKAVLKKSVNFKGAVSLAAGYGAVNLLTYAISMISYYSTAAMINNGQFDAIYSASIQMGAISKETVIELKNQIISLSVPELLMFIPNCAAVILMIASVAVFTVKGVSNKKVLPDLGIAFALHLAVVLFATLIPNTYAAVAVILVLSVAAWIYAYRVRSDIKEPEPPKPADDSFIQTIEAAKQDSSNPYEE